LIRLIPLPVNARTKGELEQEAIYDLMSYRFPVDAHERVVKDLWMDIVEGKSGLWDGIGEDKKECIRGESPTTELVLGAGLMSSLLGSLPDTLVTSRP
jgi:hypothetical protein